MQDKKTTGLRGEFAAGLRDEYRRPRVMHARAPNGSAEQARNLQEIYANPRRVSGKPRHTGGTGK